MRAKRIDANQPEIVKALRKIGCSVAVTSAAGDGFPDIVVGRTDIHGNKRNWLIEIKDGEKIPSERKLTKDQVKFHNGWKGQIAVVTSAEEAISLILGIESPPAQSPMSELRADSNRDDNHPVKTFAIGA